MNVARIADVTDNVRQVAQHQVIVMRFGMQEAHIVRSLTTGLDLLHQATLDELCQFRQRLAPLAEHQSSFRIGLCLLLADVDNPFAMLQRQIDNDLLDDLIRDLWLLG